MKLNSKLIKVLVILALGIFFCIIFQQYCYADLISPYSDENPWEKVTIPILEDEREEVTRPISEEKIEYNKLLLIVIFITTIACLIIWHKIYKDNNKKIENGKKDKENNISKTLKEKIVIEETNDKIRIEISLRQLLFILGTLGLILVLVIYILCN